MAIYIIFRIFDAMRENQFKYHKQLLTKYLLGISLFVSVFVFSPGAQGASLQNEQTNQTELVLSKKRKPSNRICSLKKIVQLADNYHFSNTALINKIALVAFDKSLIIQFRSISKHYFSYKTDLVFLPVKTIPLSSDELDISILIG